MFDILFSKLYSEIITPNRNKSFFVKNLFRDTWINWEFIENKLNDVYNIGEDTVELIDSKRGKYFPTKKQLPWTLNQKIDLEQIFDAVKKGHSLILLNCSRAHSALNEICGAIEKQHINSSVDVHIYCGNEKSKSFYPHYDNADNFIIQQTGKSHWKVYKENSFDMSERRIIKKQKELTLDYECILEPGDMIYVPLSRYHYAEPLEKRISLSFAIQHGLKPINRKWYKT